MPPRALWVSFPLGRPLGKPNDPMFQSQVIQAALRLIDFKGGPVLQDYPIDIPKVDTQNVAACPVSFVNEKVSDSTWGERLNREMKELRPWYEVSMRRRRRTIVGISDAPLDEGAGELANHLDQGTFPMDIPWLKRTVEDLKAYYLEAMTAEPGEYDQQSIQQRFWRETVLGKVILNFYEHYQHSEKDEIKLVARILAPREAIGGDTGPDEGVLNDKY